MFDPAAPQSSTPSADASKRAKALVAITLDVEMSRNFPSWDQTRWDYEKGNLDEDTKSYTVRAARLVKEHGARIHFFALGQSLEQADIGWLREIVQEGHPVGNHTYDHINVKATRGDDLQFLYRRAPWLIHGKTPRDVIIDNIRLTSLAFQERLGIQPAGLRTPGGFPNALDDRPDLQDLFLSMGFSWVSAKYPAHVMNKPGEEPSEEVFQGILKAQVAAQPYLYPNGLVEISRSPTSDINAFRAGRWKLDQFLKAIRIGLEWAIENSAVYVLLGHPSCLLVADPRMEALNLVCSLVSESRGKVAIVEMGTIAQRARLRARV